LLCLWLNATVSPRSKGELKVMLYETFKEDPLRLLDPGVVQSRLKGQRIYIESRNSDDSFQGFHAYELGADETSEWPVGYLYARDVASITPDKEVEKLELRLSGVWLEKYDGDQAIQQGSAGEVEPWILPLAAGKTRRVKANRLDNEQIRELLANPPANLTDEKLDEFDAERVRRISFSFAPLALAFVGIPLGLSARRKETSSGSGMSLGVAVAYFLFFIIADETQGSNLMLTKVLMWAPNLACIALGTFLFRRATKRA
ncbi:MAG: LptF/LptG family permease, partial [Akkermansiaceae bacterium]|nr:LptF/LptG family permease [Akkermansiaceae bacterium]